MKLPSRQKKGSRNEEQEQHDAQAAITSRRRGRSKDAPEVAGSGRSFASAGRKSAPDSMHSLKIQTGSEGGEQIERAPNIPEELDR